MSHPTMPDPKHTSTTVTDMTLPEFDPSDESRRRFQSRRSHYLAAAIESMCTLLLGASVVALIETWSP